MSRYDAFTIKSTSQYSLAFEKASILFNISAVLSCHAANQNRAEDSGVKTAYHSFQASAGMFTYINENFLHAPSTDLSRTTVKALIHITLAQAQEVFLEKQTTDGKKPAFLAKLASQASYLYSQAIDTAHEYVGKNIFDKTWATMVQAKASYLASVASYYQALADTESGSHGVAIARLQLSEKLTASAAALCKAFPSSMPASSHLAPDTAISLAELVKKHQAAVQEKVTSLIKDNDFIYHQPVPSEAGLSAVAKLPAAKAIPVSELYQGQDIQRIIGPDIFQKLVPISVTESASLYDEEKGQVDPGRDGKSRDGEWRDGSKLGLFEATGQFEYTERRNGSGGDSGRGVWRVVRGNGGPSGLPPNLGRASGQQSDCAGSTRPVFAAARHGRKRVRKDALKVRGRLDTAAELAADGDAAERHTQSARYNERSQRQRRTVARNTEPVRSGFRRDAVGGRDGRSRCFVSARNAQSRVETTEITERVDAVFARGQSSR